MKQKRRLWVGAICVLALVFSSTAMAFGAQEQETTATSAAKAVIYYTNDIHGAYENMAKIKPLVDRDNALLVDAGDAIQGSLATTLTDGQAMVDVMEAMGYDINVPGNHEFDFGMDRFLGIAENSGLNYICANFFDSSGETPRRIFDGYRIIDLDGDPATDDDQVAFIGVSTPYTLSSSTPVYFQDDRGNWIYDFGGDGTGETLNKMVQSNIDEATAQGADYIIAVAHLGEEETVENYSSRDVIVNTCGLDAVIDGHSHTVMPQETVPDKDGHPVLLTQTGTKLEYVGRLEIAEDGTMSSRLIPVADLEEIDPQVQAEVDRISDEIRGVSEKVVAYSEVDLMINDPATGLRRIRSGETNLGDLVADAYRQVLNADVAMVNGGGVRSDLKAGEITNGQIINIHPFGNGMCTARVTGQQLLDVLEYGAMFFPGENGSFMQVSGITYEIHSYLPTSVRIDDNGLYLGVDGEYRVKNVMVNGQPLDLDGQYILGSHNYLLKSGAFSMFDDAELLQDEVMLDSQLLIAFITDHLGGTIAGDTYANPYGAGRIRIVEQAPVSDETPVSRAMAVQLLYDLKGATEERTDGVAAGNAAKSRFSDVAEDAAYGEAITWAADHGIAAGYTDGSFRPQERITRQQMATMLYQYAKYAGGDVSATCDLSIYKDAAVISSYAVTPMRWACGAGVMNGRTSGELDPRGTLLYQEAQQMIDNYGTMEAR